ncbi:hypothetical protein [Secundilactobacillus odoratitofui]|nr:hypothetical protein [Secundilactobacillus odoratitofui]
MVLTQELGTLASWTTPAGGFYIWLTLPDTVSVQRLFDSAAEQGILLNPGSVYGHGASHQIRLSYAYADEASFSFGIKQLAKLIQAQLSKQ